jgi:hypothetical protein
MSAALGYEALSQMARELGRPASTLTVLSPGADPFACGTPAHVAHAEWFAQLWREHMPTRGGHLRRLHYRLVVQASPIAMVSGAPYQNTTLCWSTLKVAGKWARYLGLLDADDFDDKRPAVRRFFMDLDEGSEVTAALREPAKELGEGFGSVWLIEPRIPRLPVWEVAGERKVPQGYVLEIWVEKSDVEDVCLPLAAQYRMNYCGFNGQVGIKPCRELVERAEQSGRPIRVFYISDFDPQGESMPVAVARKVEFVLAERGLDLDIEVTPLALTKQQCVDLKLPRAPIKESDRGRGKFEERHGEGATELDALEALHPGTLHDLIEAEVLRYYDPTLEKRVKEQNQALADEVATLNESLIPGHEDELEALRKELDEIREKLKPIRKRLAPIKRQAEAWRKRGEDLYRTIAEELRADEPDFSSVHWPEPAAADEHPDPLFDSTRDYLTQIDRFKLHQGKPTERRRRKPNGGAP